MADIWINILGNASKLKGELDKAGKNVTSFSDKMVKAAVTAVPATVAILPILYLKLLKPVTNSIK